MPEGFTFAALTGASLVIGVLVGLGALGWLPWTISSDVGSNKLAISRHALTIGSISRDVHSVQTDVTTLKVQRDEILRRLDELRDMVMQLGAKPTGGKR